MASYKKDLDTLQQTAKERTVKTQTIEFDLETLVKKISKNVIMMNPDYQRNHRWKNDTSSRLIESLILNIPIPIIYISQDIDVDEDVEEGFARYSVIDGQQRLTAIYNYLSNGYPLEGLDILKELNGTYYRDLPPFLIRRLEERHIKCMRIDSTVDRQLKYDIFERLNSGAVQLEPQELRNASCRGPFRNLIKDLIKNEDYINIANITPARKKKMEDQELVLRFFAISYKDGYEEYKGGFKDFLTAKMEEYNSFGKDEIEEMRLLFNTTIDLIKRKFGDTPFAKYRYKEESSELLRMSKFNSAVFDTVSFAFVEAIQNNQEITISYEDFKELFKDPKFFSSIEGSVNDVNKLKDRIHIGTGVLL